MGGRHILFLGVLYHLRYPLLALDIVAERVRDLLVLQTLTMPGEEVLEPPADLTLEQRDQLLGPGWPKMAFIERQLAGAMSCGRSSADRVAQPPRAAA